MTGMQAVKRAAWLPAIVILVAAGPLLAEEDSRGTSFAAKPRSSTVRKLSKCMAPLPDDMLLSRLSLPGTHDTCALHNGFSFGFAKCQSWQLADQLKAGIRFIDIRCRHVGDELLIYHGVIDQKTTFKKVRDVCREFLTQHPSECLVMSVKEESTANGDTRSFADTFAASIKNDGRLWRTGAKVPSLGSVRGRIVLIDRVGTTGGLPWKNMVLQDKYTAPLDRKAKLIRSHLMNAIQSNGNQWYINFCSGTVPGSLITPRTYALQSNEVALKFLRQPRRRPFCLGAIMMDFPGEDLIEAIVESNFAPGNAAAAQPVQHPAQ